MSARPTAPTIEIMRVNWSAIMSARERLPDRLTIAGKIYERPTFGTDGDPVNVEYYEVGGAGVYRTTLDELTNKSFSM